MNLISVTTIFSIIAIALTTQQAIADPKTHVQIANTHRFDTLGIQLSYPDTYEAWRENGDLFIRSKSANHPEANANPAPAGPVDRILNARVMSQDGEYLLHIALGKGGFATGNDQQKIFEKFNKGLRVKLGSFQNPPAKPLSENHWNGYESFIICSTWDQETGFHAAGGTCYWALLSDESSYAAIDSQPLTRQDETIVRAIVKSLSFINNEK